MISVLIPTYNAGKDIFDLIQMLYRQNRNESELEIIIVDSSSRDNSLHTVRSHFPEVKIIIIDNRTFDHGGTRNKLASYARGEFLLFMTQDAIPKDEFLLEELVRPFQDKKVAVSFARQIPKEDASVLERFARGFNYPAHSRLKTKESIKELGIKTFFNSNVCSMYRAETFVKLGGFPENIILNEDMVFASKAILNGYAVSYTASAVVFHSHNYSLKQQFKRYFDIGMAFHQTSYLLQYASNEKEGFRMVFNQIKFLAGESKYFIIPRAVSEVVCKYVGYNLGKKHTILPLKLKRKYSAYMKT
ncbi:glycosyltransferase family 2 protein [Paenibacillus sp. UNC496MF]|uniref:glycosyltransferase family 2 protein n=1 Tax=Paenibacillus sp. UNC496MF TaxID=1502753 RepID=UPI000B811E78|nr:glycosyltransferase [Paenibacillus sp. UNC496MF]